MGVCQFDNFRQRRQLRRLEIEETWREFFRSLGFSVTYSPGGIKLGKLITMGQIYLPEWQCFVEIREGSPPAVLKADDIGLASNLVHKNPQYDYLIVYGVPAVGGYEVILVSVRHVKAMKQQYKEDFPFVVFGGRDPTIVERSRAWKFGSIIDQKTFHRREWLLVHTTSKCWWSPITNSVGHGAGTLDER